MLKKLTKVLSLLLILCLMVSMFPVVALADEGTEDPVVTETPEETTPVDTPVPAESPVPSESPAVEESPAPSETPADSTPVEDVPAADGPADFVLSDDADADEAIAPASTGTISYPVASNSVSLSGDFRKIVMVDAGRKYFTADWIIALINEMKADGYTTLCLAVGNDGLRFLLDDMSVLDYTSDNVKAAIRAGNDAYDKRKSYAPEGTEEWTQAEMDRIFAAAGSAGIEIIPLINTPGHMDAILYAITSLTGSGAYNGSSTTIDVTNATAVNFTYALLEKYVAYFFDKGCTAFNIGCDEYANDVYTSGGMGFGNLQSTGNYASFVNYVNGAAALVQNYGLAPICFNDGIYYNNVKTTTIDSALTICYWSSGWPGYSVRSAADLYTDRFKLINTHGDFYYVLGKADNFDSGYSYASNWDNTTFPGSSGVSNQTGSMFCIWCDFPAAETETEIAQKVRLPLRAMAAAMAGNNATAIDTEAVVPGGFNADGSLNVVVVETVTKTDETTGISVTAPGLTGLNVELREAASYPGTASITVGYNITPEDASGPYSGNAVVTVPVPAGMENHDLIRVWDVDNRTTVSRTIENNTITFEVTHFSEYDIVYNASAPTVTEDTIELVYNGASQVVTLSGEYYTEKDDVDGSYLDTNIANVTVDGTAEVPETVTYTEASVTCNTLIASDSNSWTAASGYYYTPDGTNYYPVYAKRSSVSKGALWWQYTQYTYTWGYKIGDSGPTQIGEDQVEGSSSADGRYATPDIIVYTRSNTAGTPASTKITFAPVGAGTTYVTVGSHTYKIVVARAEETVNVVINETAEIQLSGSYEVSGYESCASYTVSDDGKMTITGLAEGGFTVTDANTVYTVNVTEEDLSAVAPISVEYWITNGRPTDKAGNNSVSVAAGDAHSEDGIAVTAFVPVNTTKENRTLQFWRCRLLDTTLSNSSKSGTEKQTEDPGDDDTYNGVEFTKIRYWNGAWAVYTENNEWVEVTANHQLVAYYLEILPVADELTVTAADWGKKGDGTTSGDYLVPTSSCTVSVQVVYEDGTTNPAGTTAADLASRTIAYGYWTNGRGVGTLNLVGLEGYQIWKVEAETGAMTYASSSSTWGSFTVSSFTWDNNTMTVFEDAENPVDSYIIHNDANNPSKDGYYENLMWDENYEAILITVYVKAKPTEDNLSVIYYDEKFGEELYSYSINVAAGVTFADITPTPDAFVGNADRIDVTGRGIVNKLGVTQKFQTDLTQVPEAVGKYNSKLYTYTGSVISSDGKTLYLYYNIDTTVLEPLYVIDFGLPITFSRNVISSTSALIKDAKVAAQPKYGTLSYDAATEMFTYTPTTTLKGVDVLSISVKFDGESEYSVSNVGVMPATTVFYEEGFAVSGASKGSGNQALYVGGKSGDDYGYDAAYDRSVRSSTALNNAGFSFTGTGVDIYTNNTTADAWMMVVIKSGDTIVKAAQVNTAMKNGTTDATLNQAVNGYGVPVYSIDSLPYGSYTVTLTKISGGPVQLDGFRVYNTLENKEDPIYVRDLEDNPDFYELRNYVLASLNAGASDSNQYAAQISRSTLSQVYATAGTTGGVVITAKPGTYTEDTLQDLLNNGPKNEIYLQPGQTLTFKLNTNREVQLGLRALNDSASYTINGDAKTVSSNTDMFYTVLANTEKVAEQTVTVANTGSTILALTKLKVCDDPNFCFAELTDEDLVPALVSLGYELEPEEPEIQYADATLTVEVNGQTATLTKNGVVGESATFTAAEIEAAAQNLVPDGYALKDQAADVTVAYGESSTVSLSAEAIPTEPEQPEEPEKPDKPANIISAVIRLIDRIFGSLKGFFR